jgi:hypothetical protein
MTPCRWSPTARPGSSAPPRNASRGPPASAASCTGCATARPRCPSPPGPNSRSGCGPATKRRPGRSPARGATAWSPTTRAAERRRLLRDDFEACLAHLRFPITHRRALRTTNLLERLFLEERRRLKIIPNAFAEKAVLKLMDAAMIRAAERWRGLTVTALAPPARCHQGRARRRIPDLNRPPHGCTPAQSLSTQGP